MKWEYSVACYKTRDQLSDLRKLGKLGYEQGGGWVVLSEADTDVSMLGWGWLDILNELGRRGWELCAVIDDPHTFYFKRPLQG